MLVPTWRGRLGRDVHHEWEGNRDCKRPAIYRIRLIYIKTETVATCRVSVVRRRSRADDTRDSLTRDSDQPRTG